MDHAAPGARRGRPARGLALLGLAGNGAWLAALALLGAT